MYIKRSNIRWLKKSLLSGSNQQCSNFLTNSKFDHLQWEYTLFYLPLSYPLISLNYLCFREDNTEHLPPFNYNQSNVMSDSGMSSSNDDYPQQSSGMSSNGATSIVVNLPSGMLYRCLIRCFTFLYHKHRYILMSQQLSIYIGNSLNYSGHKIC